MKAPKFWEKDNIIAKLLTPFAAIYALQTAKRLEQKGYAAKVPVICVGNLVAGGAGKTPISIFLAHSLQATGKKVHFLCSGYGGSFEQPQKVDSKDWKKFGDEAILLAKTAPTWVGSDRGTTSKLAELDGAEILIMDDGFQNPTLEKNFSIVVVDGAYGFGNSRVMPAGPLREPIEVGLKRADCVIVIGKEKSILPKFDIPKFSAKLDIHFDPFLLNEDIVAFCGIARPQKFYNSLDEVGLKIVDTISFADHHAYTEQDLKDVLNRATELQAVVVTTEKDYVKIPKQLHMMLQLVKCEALVDKAEKLMKLIQQKTKNA